MLEHENRIRVIHSVMQVILAFLLVLFLQVLATGLWTGVCAVSGYAPGRTDLLMEISLLFTVFCILCFGKWYHDGAGVVAPRIYQGLPRVRVWLVGAALGFGGCTVTKVVLTLVQMQFPQWFVAYEKTMSNFSGGTPFLTYAYVLVLGPIAEELVFRGVMLTKLRVGMPFLAANAGQALCFGIYHMDVVQGIYAFLMGMVLGLVVEKYGSIWLSIFTHVVLNTTNYLLQIPYALGCNLPTWAEVLVLCMGVVLFLVGMWYTVAVPCE